GIDNRDARRVQEGLLRFRRWTSAVYARLGDSWHPQRFRSCSAGTWSGGGDVGSAADDPAHYYLDAETAHHRGTVVKTDVINERSVRREPHYRLRRNLTEAAAVGLGVVITIWTLVPIYNMVAGAVESRGAYITNEIRP